MAPIQKFKLGQRLKLNSAQQDAALNKIKDTIKKLYNWAKDKGYAVANTYNHFLTQCKEIKNFYVIMADPKWYKVSIRYTGYEVDNKNNRLVDANGNEITDDFQIALKVWISEQDMFEFDADPVLYSDLHDTLKAYYEIMQIAETKTSNRLDLLIAKKDIIDNILATLQNSEANIDDIPRYDKTKGRLIYSKRSPFDAGTFSDAHTTETFILENKEVKDFIIIKSLTKARQLANNKELSDKDFDSNSVEIDFSDASHANLHGGVGLGGADLSLALNANFVFGLEVKNSFAEDFEQAKKEAFNKSHDQPFVALFFYKENKLYLYYLHESDTPELLGAMSLAKYSLKSDLINPRDLPASFEVMYKKLNNLKQEIADEEAKRSADKKYLDDINYQADAAEEFADLLQSNPKITLDNN